MIFVDTSFWIAVQAPRQRLHQQAVQLFRQVQRPLLTTNLVLGESWTVIVRRAGHHNGLRLLDRLTTTMRLRIVPVSDSLEAEAWRWLRRHDERTYSFVDATSFAVMRSLDIQEALAFDEDFSAAGFTELRA
ncbi:MAG: PIN domain-containing protein [Dehalococcoidia bacterium]